MRGRRASLRGFSLPLTLALTFSLMAIAAGLTGFVTLRVHDARVQDQAVFNVITLESAIEAALLDIQKDGAPEANSWTFETRLNNQDVRLLVTPTKYKPDLNNDAAAIVTEAIGDPALATRVGALLVQPDPKAPKIKIMRFSDAMASLKAEAVEEDCMRQLLTLGRQSSTLEPRLPETKMKPRRSALAAGDLLDVRAELGGGAHAREVLWMRVRFSGVPERPWRVHDWKRLRLPPQAQACKAGKLPPPPDPKLKA